ncbi:plant-specific TFIIB-related protein 1 [Impatiens glandulifera]|uniref:plant-specific TFIIB-related protein 1 n=1 Tax=Impatiens glandulifera TaxID=253017 RepID=UPI001FB16DDD|nr:plant-specific TFIIB-related protein 1 [Impatiens glandulifera]
MRCPYCSVAQGRCATTTAGKSITECTSCGRVVEERQSQSHHLFHIRATDSPLSLVTSDLPSLPISATPSAPNDEDPFEPTGFITAFSTWSLEPYPIFAQSSTSFAGHLAELERVLETTSSTSTTSSSSVAMDNLRAYLQIIDVASILGLDYDISDHAFQLFRDCSSATCLRNRSVEALATAALVQAIREAQEPRTLQEISIAANLPQKEIGKYIKILGEALQLSQPINSNSISVHMPRFCTLLQLNKSAQELATHIGEVVINKCFCTRRNPISVSAAAIYLACQLEDKRKTQAEICKVTGLTEVTLRKVYKELLENWDDLLPSNYTPAVPPEKAFPTTTIASNRSSTSRNDTNEGTTTTPIDHDKLIDVKPVIQNDVLDTSSTFHQARGKDESVISLPPIVWHPHLSVGLKMSTERNPNNLQEVVERKIDVDTKNMGSLIPTFSSTASASKSSAAWQLPSASSGLNSPSRFMLQSKARSSLADSCGTKQLNEGKRDEH